MRGVRTMMGTAQWVCGACAHDGEYVAKQHEGEAMGAGLRGECRLCLVLLYGH